MAGESILIVDDNATNVKLIKILLEVSGYQVKCAANAENALVTLSTFSPALILMDIQLGGMDGLELTRQLKSKPQYKNLIIIALTAYAMSGDEEKALAAGCDGYITKPINTQTFPQVIADFLKKN